MMQFFLLCSKTVPDSDDVSEVLVYLVTSYLLSDDDLFSYVDT